MKHFTLSPKLRIAVAAALFFALAPSAAISFSCAEPCCHPGQTHGGGCCSGGHEPSCSFEKSAPDPEALTVLQPARKKSESISFLQEIREVEVHLLERTQGIFRLSDSNPVPRPSPLFIRFHSLLI
jgi:hypothetical protein